MTSLKATAPSADEGCSWPKSTRKGQAAFTAGSRRYFEKHGSALAPETFLIESVWLPVLISVGDPHHSTQNPKGPCSELKDQNLPGQDSSREVLGPVYVNHAEQKGDCRRWLDPLGMSQHMIPSCCDGRCVGGHAPGAMGNFHSAALLQAFHFLQDPGP